MCPLGFRIKSSQTHSRANNSVLCQMSPHHTNHRITVYYEGTSPFYILLVVVVVLLIVAAVLVYLWRFSERVQRYWTDCDVHTLS